MESRRLLELAGGSPKGEGRLERIVVLLPGGKRRALSEAELSAERGVAGDRWSLDPGADPAKQVSLINARFLAAISGASGRQDLSGDNLVVDLDLHEANLPRGTRLRIGQALLEVTAHPHTGCSRFERFYGKPANELVKSPAGMAQRLRGLYARVIEAGTARVGDRARKEGAAP
jgi:MOSC domain-containing protein YiiM